MMIFCFWSETPKFSLTKYGIEKSEKFIQKCLQGIYKDNHSIKLVRDQIVSDHMNEISIKQVTFAELFKKRYVRRLMAGLIINIGQQLTGINFFNFYSVQIFDKQSNNGSTINMLLQTGNLVGSIIALYTVQIFGRKFNFLFGIFSQCIAYILLAIGFIYNYNIFLYIAIILFIVGYAIGLGGTLYVYVSEILPPIGIAFVIFSQWVFVAFIGKFIPDIVDQFGTIAVSFGFAVICFVVFFAID